jgi:uncharacterized membrane protein YphA (DoxX/SURF4 family)
MNTALLVLRIVPGILLIGHGLQKLVPPKYSPPLLHAMGHRAGIVLAIGAGGGLATVLVGYVTRSAPARAGIPATS